MTTNGIVYRLFARSKKSSILGSVQSCRYPLQRQQHQRHRVLLFSQSAYEDPTLAWAQSNPRLAQECLNAPPINADGPVLLADNKLHSLETYLEWRKWGFPDEIILNQSKQEDFGDQNENAKALVSHILSAPLTLANNLNDMAEHCITFTSDQRNDDSVELNLCCVGARAEASIPVEYWKEFLILTRASLLSEGGYFGGNSSFPMNLSLGISLDLIGPDIPPKLSEQTVSIPDREDGNDSHGMSLSLRDYHRGFFHDIAAMKTAKHDRKPWNAYVFFNPGFGHPNLRNSWESTLQIIVKQQGLQSEPDNPRMMLLTAHSEKDAARDAAILSNDYGLKNVEYHENPFASRVAYEDPFENHHYVRPNHYIAKVHI